VGLGAYLTRLGFDVWIPEMRGHGLSQRNQNYRKNRVADYARYDLPAIGAFVREQSGQVPHWIGHSLGGITLAAALGGQYIGEPVVASAAFFGAQISRTYWPLKIPPVEWSGRFILKRFAQLSGSRLKRGPEDEPIGWPWKACVGTACSGALVMQTGLVGGFGRGQLPVLAVRPPVTIRIRPGLVASCSIRSGPSTSSLSTWVASRALPTISVTWKCWSAKPHRLKSGHWWPVGWRISNPSAG
jgi:pimeloyl-ACP methyl ester carboxylesterase